MISLQSAFVTVNVNKVPGWADVSDVVGVREEMNRRLAVEKEEVGANGTTRRRGGSCRSGRLSKEHSVRRRVVDVVVDLGKDKDTVVLAHRRAP